MQTEPLAMPEGRKVTLVTAMVQVQHFFPGSWYAPQLWRTPDGCMPYHVVWAYVRMIPSVMALQRVSQAKALLIGRGGKEAGRMLEEDHEEAFPQ